MRVLEVSDVVKQYRNGTLANDHISLALEPGEVYGLLGPNGAGKTTLVRQVLGLLKPSSGGITVNGVDVVSNPGYARANIGFLPQSEVSMAGIRVGELIEGVGRLRRLGRKEARRRSDALIERLQLEPFRKTQMVRASGGIRRLTGFAAAVVGGARLLVLDEPTNDIDPVRRQLLWTTIADLGREGIAVLLVTHNLAEAERVIDRFAIIDHGRILQEGTPSALRSLVSERLRLEVTTADGVLPHPALRAGGGPGKYFFDHEDLTRVSTWLESIRSQGKLIDFRIAPPSLDDIYTATVTNKVPEAAK